MYYYSNFILGLQKNYLLDRAKNSIDDYCFRQGFSNETFNVDKCIEDSKGFIENSRQAYENLSIFTIITAYPGFLFPTILGLVIILAAIILQDFRKK